ncbi:MAG TPA: carbon-nitrogen hydrolase family protein [Gammaproteobacteria bacterium]|nr:carbon-nitrogen hydrolase family protein [Gammaproteobacteria bacterium]
MTGKSAAVLQMNSGADVASNLRRARRLLERAAEAGATLAVLPENFACMPATAADRRRAAEEDGEGPVQDFLGAMAADCRLWIVGGTLPLRIAGETKFHAAVLVYDANGRRVARYDKFHLFDVAVPGRAERYRESRHFVAGRSLVAIETPLGRLGLAVCYDLRFPELFRVLALKHDCQLFAVPSAFTATTGSAHWDSLLRARALENQCFLLAAAQTGRHPGGRETYGRSRILGPWGETLATLGRRSGVAQAPIDLSGQARLRRGFPVLEQARRRELEPGL